VLQRDAPASVHAHTTFRVNAGAVSSYVLSSQDRTNYLSELRQGDTVIGVKVNGDTRPLVVGRAKIEHGRCS